MNGMLIINPFPSKYPKAVDTKYMMSCTGCKCNCNCNSTTSCKCRSWYYDVLGSKQQCLNQDNASLWDVWSALVWATHFILNDATQFKQVCEPWWIVPMLNTVTNDLKLQHLPSRLWIQKWVESGISSILHPLFVPCQPKCYFFLFLPCEIWDLPRLLICLFMWLDLFKIPISVTNSSLVIAP